MTTVAGDLDIIQERLHDGGVIWPRDELLRWYRDGYRDLIARSQCVGRLTCLDVPGAVTYGRMYEWEARHVDQGTSWKFTLTTYDEQYQCMYAWEAQMLIGIEPEENSTYTYTQPWERAFTDDSVQEFTFALPRNHERIRAVWWNHERLDPITTRELDYTEQRWMRLAGEPTHWTDGFGRNRMFDIFGIRTDYRQGYYHTARVGIPRHASGERSYTVNNQHPVSVSGTGLVRWVSSPDRQYWPQPEHLSREALGIARDWGSSDNALLAWESIIPDVDDLEEAEEPGMIPAPVQKYLRDYVLWQARGRQGEGHNPNLAQHYQMRYQRGIALMRKLADVAHDDRQFVREPVSAGSRRPPRVQLPPEFPRVW